MVILLSLFSVLFVSWLIYISLFENATSTLPRKDYKDQAKVTLDTLDQLNTILEIKDNPEKAE